jgi:putative phage-type endonuclease
LVKIVGKSTMDTKCEEDTIICDDGHSLSNLLSRLSISPEDDLEPDKIEENPKDSENIVQKWMEVNSKMETLKQEIIQKLTRPQEELDKIGTYEQRSEAWHESRNYRLTGSNFGSAIGHNKYQSPKALVNELLWKTFHGNEMTKYGELNEPIARDIYMKYMRQTHPDDQIEVEVPGLFVSAKYPFLGCSPDGIVMIRKKNGDIIYFLIEIKCPWKREYYPDIPAYYYSQIQGMMGLKNLPYCDFIVFLPEETRIQRYMFNPEYFHKTLIPKLTHFYFNMYLPALIYKEQGLLEPGNIEPILHVSIPQKTMESEQDNDDPSFF